MPKMITVTEGDCFINICKQEGFFWETVWNHPENEKLRERRKHLNILKKEDQIYLPDLEIKEYTVETEQRHKFCLVGSLVEFTLTLLNLGEPRANEDYILKVNGSSKRGCTDENGTLTERIPADARDGLLLLGANQEEIAINFGYMDPIDEISGVQRRLQNLGFYEGEIDDELNIETIAAIAEFQRSVELSGEGELNEETRQKLLEVHEV
jgi:N-acetylmuramoyl-L-alanine amidase